MLRAIKLMHLNIIIIFVLHLSFSLRSWSLFGCQQFPPWHSFLLYPHPHIASMSIWSSCSLTPSNSISDVLLSTWSSSLLFTWPYHLNILLINLAICLPNEISLLSASEFSWFTLFQVKIFNPGHLITTGPDQMFQESRSAGKQPVLLFHSPSFCSWGEHVTSLFLLFSI